MLLHIGKSLFPANPSLYCLPFLQRAVTDMTDDAVPDLHIQNAGFSQPSLICALSSSLRKKCCLIQHNVPVFSISDAALHACLKLFSITVSLIKFFCRFHFPLLLSCPESLQFIQILLQLNHFIPQFSCLFKIQIRRRLLHLFLHLADQLFQLFLRHRLRILFQLFFCSGYLF